MGGILLGGFLGGNSVFWVGFLGGFLGGNCIFWVEIVLLGGNLCCIVNAYATTSFSMSRSRVSSRLNSMRLDSVKCDINILLTYDLQKYYLFPKNPKFIVKFILHNKGEPEGSPLLWIFSYYHFRHLNV